VAVELPCHTELLFPVPEQYLLEDHLLIYPEIYIYIIYTHKLIYAYIHINTYRVWKYRNYHVYKICIYIYILYKCIPRTSSLSRQQFVLTYPEIYTCPLRLCPFHNPYPHSIHRNISYNFQLQRVEIRILWLLHATSSII
jgi:hypothetical protein